MSLDSNTIAHQYTSKYDTVDINKYITGLSGKEANIDQEDINLIEIYFINRRNIQKSYDAQETQDTQDTQDNVIDVSVKNSLETFIDNYYKKSRVEKYKSYTHKERTYTYELSNDNQYVSSKIKKNMDILGNILVICSKNNKQPNYTFPCTNEIDSISEYTIKEYKISNRISLIMHSDSDNDNDNDNDIKTLYIEYRHSNNVDIDKINETINKIIRKILYQLSQP
jgi:hypothetical protein